MERLETATPVDRFRTFRTRNRDALAVAGRWPLLAFVAALLIATTTPAWRLDLRTWRISLPMLPDDGHGPFTAIVFVACVVLLAIAWIGLVLRVERSHAPDRLRTRAVVLFCALVFVPILAGPPLLSSDVYSYGAQGDMVNHGFDPSKDSLTNLRYGDYVAMTDPVWRSPQRRGADPTTQGGSPYGPVQMGLAAALVDAGGHNPAVTAFLFKIVAALFVALAGWAITDIARRHGMSPPVALALAIANPIVAIHLVGGAHNDAVMLGLLLAGIALAERNRYVLAIVLMSAAALVKLPAAAGIVFVAWNRPGIGAAVKDRVRAVTGALGISVVFTLVACAVVGVGLGFIGAMRNTGSTTGTLSFVTQSGYVVSHALQAIGINASDKRWVDGFRLVGLGAAGLLSLWLLWHSPRFGTLRSLGLCLLAVILLGPVVWPWYLAPIFAILFAAGAGRWRPSVMLLSVVFAAEVWPSGANGNAKPVLEQQHLVNLLLVVGIGIAAAAAPWVVDWWHAARHGETDSTATGAPVALAD